jgi:hypothetical protein
MNREAVAARSCGRKPAEIIHTVTPSREAATAPSCERKPADLKSPTNVSCGGEKHLVQFV